MVVVVDKPRSSVLSGKRIIVTDGLMIMGIGEGELVTAVNQERRGNRRRESDVSVYGGERTCNKGENRFCRAAR